MKKLCFVLVLAVASLWAENLDFESYKSYLAQIGGDFLAKDYKQMAKAYWGDARIYRGSYGGYGWGNVPYAWEDGYYDEILSYLEGRKKDESQKEVKQDYTKARLLAEVACEGKVVEHDSGKWFERETEPIGQACEILGDIYAQGKGVKQDLAKAKSLYQKACENPLIYSSNGRGYSPCGGSYSDYYQSITRYGCKQLGDIYYIGKNFKEARKWWARAVKQGCLLGGCFDIYNINNDITNDSFEVSSGYYQEAEGYYKGYTTMGVGDDFPIWTEIIKEQRDYSIWAENHIRERIDNVSRVSTQETTKHELDYNKAVILASIGCNDFKESKYCYMLADALTKGKGIIKSGSLARQYLKKAAQYDARDIYKLVYGIGYTCDSEYDEAKKQEATETRAEIKVLLKKACALDKTSEACIALKNKDYEK